MILKRKRKTHSCHSPHLPPNVCKALLCFFFSPLLVSCRFSLFFGDNLALRMTSCLFSRPINGASLASILGPFFRSAFANRLFFDSPPIPLFLCPHQFTSFRDSLCPNVSSWFGTFPSDCPFRSQCERPRPLFPFLGTAPWPLFVPQQAFFISFPKTPLSAILQIFLVFALPDWSFLLGLPSLVR